MSIRNGQSNGRDHHPEHAPTHASEPTHGRDGWEWCHGCQALREPWHRHGDPVEQYTREALILLVRALQEQLQEAGR